MSLVQTLTAMHPQEGKWLSELVEAWLDVASAGMTLVSCNAKIRGVEDYAQFFQGEGPQMLQVIVETRKRLLAKQAQCSVRASVGKDKEGDFEKVLQLEVPEALLTELKSEKLDDILSWKFADIGRSLDAATSDLKEKTVQHLKSKGAPTEEWLELLASASGPHSWTFGLGDASDLEALHSSASTALFPFAPGKLLKTFADTAAQEAG